MTVGHLRLQTFVHSLTQGRLGQTLRMFFFLAASLGLLLAYHSIQFKGLDAPESMEVAHLARQIRDGQGFTTLHIRPATLDLLQKHGVNSAQIATRQPEIANAPLYPYMLAQVFRAARARFDILPGQLFTIFPAENWCCIFSEFWFLASIPIFYLVCRRASDPRTTLVVIALVVLCNPFWRYAISGTCFTFLLFLFGVVCYGVVRFNESSDHRSSLLWTLLAALAIGLGFLTKYRFGLLLLPLATYLLFFGGRYRLAHLLVALLTVAGIAAPWINRNMQVSGLPLGLATYAPIQYTDVFQSNSYEKEVHPTLENFTYKQLQRKWLANAHAFFETDIKSLGGNYLVFFCLTSLLFVFRSRQLHRLRWFFLFNLLWMALWLPFIWNVDAPVYSGNLYALLVPLIFLFGTILFWMLYDRLNINSRPILMITGGAFIILNSLPLIFTLLPPRPPPYRYPPYYPPMIYSVSKWMSPGELVMSDMPWAVAWYGNTTSIDLTKDMTQFMEINDYIKKVDGIYFTPLTLARPFNELISGESGSWSPLILRQVPENFPLRAPVPNLGKDFLFITDRVRWPSGGG